MRILGLTGSIGMGKSTAAVMLPIDALPHSSRGPPVLPSPPRHHVRSPVPSRRTCTNSVATVTTAAVAIT